MAYKVEFIIAGRDAQLDEEFSTEQEARSVAATLEENGADIASIEPVS